jgi:hypothetical protein
MTDFEIKDRTRMRPLYEWLHKTSDKALANDPLAMPGWRGADDLGDYMRHAGFKFDDLVALRDRPHFYDMHHAQKWLWWLHNVMNHHGQAICIRIRRNVI